MAYKLSALVGGKKKKKEDDYTFSPESQAVYNELFAKPDPNVLNAYDKTFGTTAKKSENLANQYGKNKFQYNPETDPNYQAYLKLAKENAGLAMQDTLAKASAMTGGYSNSNAQLAGQKVYNQHLSEAEGRVGDFYAMALDAFNAEQNNLLNQIELAWAAEDRDKQNAQFKAEYGDYSGLTDLGISQEAVDKYKANADWATQYAKDSAAYENAWKLAEATGDYTNVYNQLGYTDEQIAALRGGNIDLEPVTKKLSSFTTNADIESYIDSLESAGYIDSSTADKLYATYKLPEQLPFADRKYTVEYAGGINWGNGIDNNAKVKDEYGNTYRLSDLKKHLINEGMDKEKAKEYIINLQKKLNI